MPRQRRSKDERRREILSAARNCFLTLGIARTTMEAVVSRTSLSKGGVYRYYRSTEAMLHDLMRDGTAHRMPMVDALFMCDDSDEAFVSRVVDLVYDKMTDRNEDKRLYALFLLEAARSAPLTALKASLHQEFYDQLARRAQSAPRARLSQFQALMNPTLVALIDALIVAVECLGLRETLTRDPDHLKRMIRASFTDTETASTSHRDPEIARKDTTP